MKKEKSHSLDKVKNRKPFFLFTMMIFSLSLISCKNHNPAGHGHSLKPEIIVENGIKTIINSNSPLYGDLRFNLGEPLTISDKNIEPWKIEDFEVDEFGNIYVLDIGNLKILKFDKSGELKLSFGRKGEGPGEFQTPYAIFLSSDNNINLHDGMSIKKFTEKGEYIETLRLRLFFHRVYLNDKDNIFGISRLYLEKESRKGIVIFLDKEGSPKNVATFPYPPKSIIPTVDGYVSLFIDHYYVPKLYLTGYNTKDFIFAHSSQYLVNIVNSQGNIRLIIKKDESRISISENEKSEVLTDLKYLEKKFSKNLLKKSTFFPKYKPFFDKILVDDKGRIYVQRLNNYEDRESSFNFDVFDKNGRYIYKLKLRFSPDIIKNGYIYYKLDEDDIQKIFRLKINESPKL